MTISLKEGWNDISKEGDSGLIKRDGWGGTSLGDGGSNGIKPVGFNKN